MSPQYGELWPTNGWDRFQSVRHHSKFQRSMGFASCLCYCIDVHWRPTELCTIFDYLLGWYTIHFPGLLPPDRILPRAKLTLRPSHTFSYIGSITARHSSSGRQPSCGMVQGMELRNLHRGRHLYSAGRPSHWASGYILVLTYVIVRNISRY